MIRPSRVSKYQYVVGSKKRIEAIDIHVMGGNVPDRFKLELTNKPSIGSAAPELKLEHLLQAPDNTQYILGLFER